MGDVMKCPICEKEMLEGGLVFGGYSPTWVDKNQLNKAMVMEAGHELVAESNYLTRQTKVKNAFYCEQCNKVTGIFDVRYRTKRNNTSKKTEESI